MDPFHLKLKVGLHEFDATGDPATVKEQLALWRELIGTPAASPAAMASPPPLTQPPGAAPAVHAVSMPAGDRGDYKRLFRQDKRSVSLTVLPSGEQREADALLVLMLGHKLLSDADQVSGQLLGDGMRLSGLVVERVDRSWGPHLDANVLRTGVKRGVKYRLTHPGVARAKQIADALLALVP